MSSTENQPKPFFPIPDLAIRSKSYGRTTLEPEIFSTRDGRSITRSLKIEMGPCGEPLKVTAELVPSEVIMHLEEPIIALTMDGQAVASFTLADGTVIRPGQRSSDYTGILPVGEWNVSPGKNGMVLISAKTTQSYRCWEMWSPSELPKRLEELSREAEAQYGAGVAATSGSAPAPEQRASKPRPAPYQRSVRSCHGDAQ